MAATPEFLFGLNTELKKLVGHGAHPKRLALLPLPKLRELAGVEDGTLKAAAGDAIFSYLVESIDTLTGSYEFEEKKIDAHQLKRWLRLLLKLEGTGQDAENRRGRVVRGLAEFGIYYSVDQWRREFGPERYLLRILAEHMISQNS